MEQTCDSRQFPEALILVAEDDQITTMVLNKILTQAGFRADFVTDGNAVISALKLADYDLVLMDCFMPQMDGFAATRLIRNANSAEINPEIPIIAMTGLSGKGDRQRCLDAGMDDHLCKPVDAAQLILVIEQHLGRAAGQAKVLQQGENGNEPIWEESFLETMIDRFLTEIPGVVDGLQKAADSGDLAELESIGHRLRGACDIMGVSTLSTRSRALEQAGKAGDLSVTCKRAFELIAELQKMETALTGAAG